jgi:serine/threonine protein kinase
VENDNYNEIISMIEGQPSINGRYENIRRIDDNAGEGNFSFVFIANDLVTKKPVALKFHNIFKGGEYRQQSYYREERVLERLKGQPDTLQLIESGCRFPCELQTANGHSIPVPIPFFSTDLGLANMVEMIYNKNLTPLKRLRHFGTMCRAVQRLHCHKICHRDLKLSNFFIIKGGQVCLGDFGTAKILDGTENDLATDYPMGPGDKRCMAPEMFVSLEHDVAIHYSADMFSLGAILFEMFTKQKLFNSVFFNTAFVDDLSTAFKEIPKTDKPEIFGRLIGEIAQARPLPNMYDFDGAVPECISQRLDMVFKKTACLDYRKRTTDFAWVFGEINRCFEVLQQETNYMRLIELRRQWQENHRLNQERNMYRRAQMSMCLNADIRGEDNE